MSPATGAWLLTGAGGQLGRSLRREAAQLGVELHAFTHAELDVGDAAAVEAAVERVRPQVVINAAAFTQVDRCEELPEQAHRVNAGGPAALAAACRGGALLIHLSTDYVFPGTTSRPIPENAKSDPRSVYGRTKWEGEEAVRNSGVEHLIVRTQWLFGPGPCFVRTILTKAREGARLRVVEDQLGRPTGTDPLAASLCRAALSPLRGTLHLACEGIASWYDFARAIVERGARLGLCPQVAVDPVDSSAFPRPAPRPAYGVLGLERSRELGLGLPHWETALEHYLEEEVSGRV